MPLQQRITTQFFILPRPKTWTQSLQSRGRPTTSISSSNPSSPTTTNASRKISQTTQARNFQTTRRRLTAENSNKLPTTPDDPSRKTSNRLDKILSRLPTPLRRYTSRLKSAPLSHVVAFLILHEITAILPLLGLFGLFHYSSSSTTTSSSPEGRQQESSWLPIGYILDHYGNYVQDGVTRFESYFTKKGWFGFGGPDLEAEVGTATGILEGQAEHEEHAQVVIQKWEDRTSDPKYRILVEIALAYALTKALLPVRIVASVSATPWFAGVLGRLRTFATRRKP